MAEFGREEVMKITGTVTEEEMNVKEADKGGLDNRQEVVLLDNEIAFNEAIIEERELGIQEIQQQIGEVNEVFKDLAVLVHEQGTIIDDIGSHIENSQVATAQGKSQLVKAAKTQRSNSSLTCLLLVIFGIVLLILVVVLAA
ncbi:syntaxin-22-like [Citrus clementina]|uniref:syntaxin-22-like n=1 Tax=Citrus clementina TaxID=85681 RepID=UPI000CED18E4|nr:syntaxin-22-like [Citrus x clementina]